jgi:hypothetical protein
MASRGVSVPVHGLGLCPKRADGAGTSPWRSDTARGTGEPPRVGCASIYCYRPSERKGWRAGPHPAQRRSDLSRCLSKASTPEQTAAPAPSGVRFPTLPLLPFVVRLTVGLGSGRVPLLRGPAAVGCEGRFKGSAASRLWRLPAASAISFFHACNYVDHF